LFHLSTTCRWIKDDHKAASLHHLTSRSTTCCPTTWRSYCDHILAYCDVTSCSRINCLNVYVWWADMNERRTPVRFTDYHLFRHHHGTVTKQLKRTVKPTYTHNIHSIAHGTYTSSRHNAKINQDNVRK